MLNLNDILKNIDLKNISNEQNSYIELPDGYYLVQIERAEIVNSKTSGNLMVRWELTTLENGIGFDENTGGTKYIEKTAQKRIYHYHILNSEQNVTRLLSDLLKFEIEGQPAFSVDMFVDQAHIEAVLDGLQGLSIWINLTTKNSKGESSQWKNFISFRSAKQAGLIN